MPSAEWKAGLSADTCELEEEHDKLLVLLGELQRALETNASHDLLGKILEKANYYLNYHFVHEEELFLRTHYPDYDAHRREHLAIKTAAAEIGRDFELRASDALPPQVLEFFQYRFDEHTRTWDDAFAAHLEAYRSKP